MGGGRDPCIGQKGPGEGRGRAGKTQEAREGDREKKRRGEEEGTNVGQCQSQSITQPNPVPPRLRTSVVERRRGRARVPVHARRRGRRRPTALGVVLLGRGGLAAAPLQDVHRARDHVRGDLPAVVLPEVVHLLVLDEWGVLREGRDGVGGGEWGRGGVGFWVAWLVGWLVDDLTR